MTPTTSRGHTVKVRIGCDGVDSTVAYFTASGRSTALQDLSADQLWLLNHAAMYLATESAKALALIGKENG